MAADTGLPEPWIFGYGSLIWRTEFPFEERVPAWIEGWGRKFWQGSTDHRGVPGAPGRVVTLIEESATRCWGMAFRIDPRHAHDVMNLLDYREKGGYERLELPLHLESGRVAIGVTWVARAGNQNYLGPAPLESIAAQISAARGPSGSNLEYFFNLHRTLIEMAHPDPHVSELAAHLQALENPAGLR